MKRILLLFTLTLSIAHIQSTETSIHNPTHNLSIIIDHKRSNVSLVNFTTAHAVTDIQNHNCAILISKALLERILIASELVKDTKNTLEQHPHLSIFTKRPKLRNINFDSYFTSQEPPKESTIHSFQKESESFRTFLDNAQLLVRNELEKKAFLEHDFIQRLPKQFTLFGESDYSAHFACYAAQFNEHEWDMRSVTNGFILLIPKTMISKKHTDYALGLNVSHYKPITTTQILAGFEHKEIKEDQNKALPKLLEKLFTPSKKYNDFPLDQPFWNVKATGHGLPQEEGSPKGEVMGIAVPTFTQCIKALNKTKSINQLFITSCFASDINLKQAFIDPTETALPFPVNFDIITDAFMYQEVHPQRANFFNFTLDHINQDRKTIHLLHLFDYGKDYFTSPQKDPQRFFKAMINKLTKRRAKAATNAHNFIFYRHIPTIRFRNTLQFFPLVVKKEKELVTPVFSITKVNALAKAASEKSFVYTQKDFETFNAINPNNIAPKPIGLYTNAILAPLVIKITKLFPLPRDYHNWTEIRRFPQIISLVPGNTLHYFKRITMPNTFYTKGLDDLEDLDPLHQLSIFKEPDNNPSSRQNTYYNVKKNFFIETFEMTEVEYGETKRITLKNLFVHTTSKGVEYFYTKERDTRIYQYSGLSERTIDAFPEEYNKAKQQAHEIKAAEEEKVEKLQALKAMLEKKLEEQELREKVAEEVVEEVIDNAVEDIFEDLKERVE